MALFLKLSGHDHVHAGGGGRRRHRLLILCLVACLAILPLARASEAAASAITHLPGLDEPLPFHMETGYVGVDEETGTELFYYFMESEGNPATDPVLLWLSGGPLCSAFCGLAFEIGPVRFVVKP